MKRRLIAIFASLALCFSMIPATALADPSDILIDEVIVSIEIPKVGASDTTVKYSISAGAGYSLGPGYAGWLDPDWQPASGFEEGNVYHASFNVIPEPGYALTENTIVTVNGSAEGVELLGDSVNPASVFNFTTYPDLVGSITSVVLNGVPPCEIGRQAQGYSYDEGRYVATGSWASYNRSTGAYDPMSTIDTFENGGIYRLSLDIDPDEGYVLDPNCSLSVNDEDLEWYPGSLHGVAYDYFSFVTEIWEISVSSADLPKAEIGKTFSDSSHISIPVAGGSNYDLAGYWFYIDDLGMEATSGTFEEGKVYYLRIIVTPHVGFSLAQDFAVIVDGVLEWAHVDSSTRAYFDARTSFAGVISEVELLNLPSAVLGDTLQAGAFPVSVPSGAPYSATASWLVYDADSDVWVSVDPSAAPVVVKEGGFYRLEANLRPSAGFEFEDLLTVWAYGAKHSLNGSVNVALFEREFSFLETISQVSISGVTPPVAGATPSVTGLSVPADARYRIAHAEWLDANTGVAPTTFLAGHDYELIFWVKPDKGYGFPRNLVVLLDGEAIHADVEDEGAWVRQIYSLKEVLPEIRVDNVPTMEVGQVARTDVVTPADAKYHAFARWLVWNDSTERYEDFAGTFERGKAYTLNVSAAPNDGYCFSQDVTVFFVNGTEAGDALIDHDFATYHRDYATGLEIISRIELKIDPPVAGQHASVAPVISVVGGAGFKVVEGDARWVVASPIDPSITFLFHDYFAADGDYGVSFALRAQAGFAFAEDVEVIVNGVVLPASVIDEGIKEIRATHYFKTESSSDGSDDAIAQTGDDATRIIWLSLMALLSFSLLLLGVFTGRVRRIDR